MSGPSAVERNAIQVGKTALRQSPHPCSDIVEQVVGALYLAGLLVADMEPAAVEPLTLALPDRGAS